MAYDRVQDLPPVDIFVTTADPQLEPPMVTVNTVLSLLAVDYEAHKLACYVSDDAGSPVTLYSLIQAAEFGKRWVLFCKKYEVQVRAPFRYFGAQVPLDDTSLEFQQEWQDMKNEYDQLNLRVEEASKPDTKLLDSKEFSIFATMKRDNHESIVKVIRENKGPPDELPHLIYVAREKRPKHPHHYKAGAMNVLTRVSGVMTNAPFMLNVDCDMFVNNPQTFHHAMCLLLGTKTEEECAFVQFPQKFYNGLKDDPFGNQLVALHETMGLGMVGIQGPAYSGTGCFHRRKIIYGLPNDQDLPVQLQNGILVNPDQVYGKSLELINFIYSVGSTLTAKHSILDSLDAAHKVADCDYEFMTRWGINIGWIYGSATEDVLTGLTIQSRGYKTMYCDPDPPSFLGCAPPSGPLTATQMKRWATGLLEILFSARSPIILFLTTKLHFRQSLGYTWVLVWGLRSVPELCYSLLPPYCILSNSAFLPKIDQPAWLLPISLFMIYNFYTLYEYLQCGQSMRSWWNNQRASRINSSSAWLFGFICVILKLLGLSETVFELTRKENLDSDDGVVDEEIGRFTFDESPIFIPATTLVTVNLVAVGLGFVRMIWAGPLWMSGVEYGAGELGCCVWVLLMFRPFVKGLFGKGKYGIPTRTIWKSTGLALAFFSFCLRV
uniref:Cellulose synthase-like protein H1 n=1 Tax=Kalanchoe fedtschenkoi TaxID=63787 RepID=A0A7N0RIY2_KALFE